MLRRALRVAAVLVLAPTGTAISPAAAAPATPQRDFLLTDHSMVIIPVDNQRYADLAGQYLEAAGFSAEPAVPIGIVNIPEYLPFSTLTNTVNVGTDQLVEAILDKWDGGAGFDADDPLFVFGYSQGAVVSVLAQQELFDAGIPQDALHFVLVGNSASAQGGWLNSFLGSLDWLPQWLVGLIRQNLELWGIAPPVLDATTPDHLYATDVWTLSGDGWANWDNGTNIAGMFSDHLWYLGLSPEEIANTVDNTVGLTTYHMMDSAAVNGLEALWNAFLMAVDFTQW
ncbi:PE-PPE domain-containing protein [Mycobacterium sp. UM_Kg1]|uniref:PE-PPE domain-containing protein n=1 Tax=Mycobacterium sp. UM_Kg1 TaxID=1545691 RepID=UPI0006968614|nr:PE-PPE domain-containing protein [Mycobacterium sp. UM_Kg1]